MTLVTVEGQEERRDSEISISQKRGQAGGAATVHPTVGWGPDLTCRCEQRCLWAVPLPALSSFTASLRPFIVHMSKGGSERSRDRHSMCSPTKDARCPTHCFSSGGPVLLP